MLAQALIEGSSWDIWHIVIDNIQHVEYYCWLGLRVIQSTLTIHQFECELMVCDG